MFLSKSPYVYILLNIFSISTLNSIRAQLLSAGFYIVNPFFFLSAHSSLHFYDTKTQFPSCFTDHPFWIFPNGSFFSS